MRKWKGAPAGQQCNECYSESVKRYETVRFAEDGITTRNTLTPAVTAGARHEYRKEK